jgi:hypothetical protein
LDLLLNCVRDGDKITATIYRRDAENTEKSVCALGVSAVIHEVVGYGIFYLIYQGIFLCYTNLAD